MLNFVHTFGATKDEFRDMDRSLAPSAPYAGTTEGTCAKATYICLSYLSLLISQPHRPRQW
jgi:hypothetical protein